MKRQPTKCEPESMDSEDDLFVMFTSGATESPKGIIHSQAGYLLHVAVTQKVSHHHYTKITFIYLSIKEGQQDSGSCIIILYMQYYFNYQPGEIFACTAESCGHWLDYRTQLYRLWTSL